MNDADRFYRAYDKCIAGIDGNANRVDDCEALHYFTTAEDTLENAVEAFEEGNPQAAWEGIAEALAENKRGVARAIACGETY